MQGNSLIRSGLVTGEAWLAIMALTLPEKHDYDYIRTVYAEAPLLGLDPGIVLAQWSHETNKGTSVRWNRDKNPAGIGIPADDTPQPFPIADGVEAARIHLATLNMLVDSPVVLPFQLPSAAADWLGTVWREHVRQGPAVRTIDDLNIRYPCGSDMCATWAWDAAYAEKLLDHFAFLFPVDPPLVGEQALVPCGRCNTPCSPLNAGSKTITVHENGNPRSSADAERAFVAGERNADGSCRPSYHFAVDAEKVVQIMPLDRIGHHAADGCDNRNEDIGCFASVAIETVQTAAYPSAQWERTLRNLVRLIAMIKQGSPAIVYGTEDPAAFANDRLNQHNDWYKVKNCPERIRNDGRWPQIVWAVKLATTSFPSGPREEPPKPEYAVPPAMPKWDGEDVVVRGSRFYAYHRRVTAKERVTPNAVASRQTVRPTNHDIQPGRRVSVYWAVKGKDEWWYVLKDGSRVPTSAFEEPFPIGAE